VVETYVFRLLELRTDGSLIPTDVLIFPITLFGKLGTDGSLILKYGKLGTGGSLILTYEKIGNRRLLENSNNRTRRLLERLSIPFNVFFLGVKFVM
jgi:hypothetical protein